MKVRKISNLGGGRPGSTVKFAVTAKIGLFIIGDVITLFVVAAHL